MPSPASDDPDYEYDSSEEYEIDPELASTATAAQLEAAKKWTLPVELMGLAAAAEVELTVTLGYGVKVKRAR